MDEIQKLNRANKRNKYLRTDKSKKSRNIGCHCTRCFGPLSNKVYREQTLKQTNRELNKHNYQMCEFI